MLLVFFSRAPEGWASAAHTQRSEVRVQRCDLQLFVKPPSATDNTCHPSPQLCERMCVYGLISLKTIYEIWSLGGWIKCDAFARCQKTLQEQHSRRQQKLTAGFGERNAKLVFLFMHIQEIFKNNTRKSCTAVETACTTTFRLRITHVI